MAVAPFTGEISLLFFVCVQIKSDGENVFFTLCHFDAGGYGKESARFVA